MNMLSDSLIPKVKRRKASTVSLGDLPVRYPNRIPSFQLKSQQTGDYGRTWTIVFVLTTVFMLGIGIGLVAGRML